MGFESFVDKHHHSPSIRPLYIKPLHLDEDAQEQNTRRFFFETTQTVRIFFFFIAVCFFFFLHFMIRGMRRIHVLDHLGCQSKSKSGKRRKKEVKETVSTLQENSENSQAFYRLYWEVGSLTSQRQLKEGRENSY